VKITLNQFGGVAPKQNPRYLQEVQAQVAVDCAVNTGPLRPLADAAPVGGVGVGSPSALGQTIRGNAVSIYRLGQNESDARYWASWNADVDVAGGMVNGDETERTFFTGDGAPKYMTIPNVTFARPLGVEAPTNPPVAEEGEFRPTKHPAEVILTAEDLELIDLDAGMRAVLQQPEGVAPVMLQIKPPSRSPSDVLSAFAADSDRFQGYVAGTGVVIQTVQTGTEAGLTVGASGSYDYVVTNTGQDAESSVTTKTVASDGGGIPFQISPAVLGDMTWVGGTMMYVETGGLVTHYNILLPWFRYKFAANDSWTYLVVGASLPYISTSPTPKTYGSLGEIAGALNGAGMATRIVGDSLYVSGVVALEYRSVTWKHYHNHLSHLPGDYNWVSPGPAPVLEQAVVDIPARDSRVYIPLKDLNAAVPFGFYVQTENSPKVFINFDRPLETDGSNLTWANNLIANSAIAQHAWWAFRIDGNAPGLDVTSKTVSSAGATTIFLPDPAKSFKRSGSGWEEAPGVKETRIYTYTYVNALGEESTPYAADPMPESTEVSVYANQDVVLGLPVVQFPQPPWSSLADVTKRRVYRSVAGTASFLFVKELSIDDTTFTDNVDASLLGEECPSIFWSTPPATLQGLTALPNGILAGFVGHDVFFSEPYRPFAWPATYSASVAYPIIGMGAVDTTLVVLTKGKPYFVQGTHPDAMVVVEADVSQACVSKRSIVSLNGLVVYASPDGLVGLAPNGSRILTEALFDKAQWQSLNPQFIHGYAFENAYIGFFGYSGGGFIVDMASGSFMFHGINAMAGYTDLRNDTLYIWDGAALGKWGEGAPRTFTWRSKRFTTPVDGPLSTFRIGSEAYPVSVQFTKDGEGYHTETVADDNPRRLPPGRGRTWDVQVSGVADLYSIEVSQSVAELMNG